MDEVILEVEITWASQQRFQLELKPLPRIPLPLGYGDLSIGDLSLKFVGSISVICSP